MCGALSREESLSYLLSFFLQFPTTGPKDGKEGLRKARREKPALRRSLGGSPATVSRRLIECSSVVDNCCVIRDVISPEPKQNIFLEKFGKRSLFAHFEE